MKNIFLFIIFSLGWAIQSDSQINRRHVLGSIGSFKSGTNFKMNGTFGQPPNVSTLSNNQMKIRQGFQQPLNSDADCGLATFIVEATDGTCGTYYNLTYTGEMGTGSQFMWDFGENGIPQTSTEIMPEDVVFSDTGSQVVTLWVTRPDSCVLQGSYLVNVTQLAFAVDIEVEHSKCFGDNLGQLTLNPVNGAPPYQILWSDGNTDANRSNLSPGRYDYTVTDSEGCQFIGIEEVLGANLPLMLSNDEVLHETCTGTLDGQIKVDFFGGEEPYAYLWSNGATSQNITNLGTGNYQLTVTDALGCSSQHSYDIEVFCEKEDVVYTIFTPNDDGTNDTWEIENIEAFPNNRVEVYNRWGQIVFEANGYQNDWKAISTDGGDLPAGAYYFVVKLNDANDSTYAGAVTILR